MTQRNADPLRSSYEHIKHALGRTLLSAAWLGVVSLVPATATAEPCAAPPGASCVSPESDEAQVAPEPLVIERDPSKALQERPLCRRDQLAAIERRWAPAVVEVDGQFGFARGLLVLGGRYVLTHTDPVRYGRGFVIRGRGKTLGWTRIAAFDDDSGLALIELETRVATPRVRWAKAAPKVGTPVVLAVSGYDDSIGPVVEVSPGVVGGAALEPLIVSLRAGGTGAPIFDCEGRVLGIAKGGSDGFVSAARAQDIVDNRDRLPDYEGSWSAAHFAIGLAVQVEGRKRALEAHRRAYIGLQTGGAITGFDRLYLPYRFSLLVSAQGRSNQRTFEPTTELQGLKLQTELGVGYRFLLAEAGFLSTYLVPQVGMAFGWERDVFMQRTPSVPAGCSNPSCPVTTQTVETQQSRWFWRPTVGLALQTSVFEVGYSVQLELKDLRASTHQFFLGASL